MSKKEIINKANAHLEKFNEVLRIKNELDTKIEKNKRRAQKVSANRNDWLSSQYSHQQHHCPFAQIERDLLEYETKMPEMKETIETLTAQEIDIDNEYTKKANDIKNSETILKNLETREHELDQRMVNENEYENCVRDIEEADKELATLNQAAEHSKSSNMNTCRKIDEMEQILKEILALIDDIDVAELEDTVYVFLWRRSGISYWKK